MNYIIAWYNYALHKSVHILFSTHNHTIIRYPYSVSYLNELTNRPRPPPNARPDSSFVIQAPTDGSTRAFRAKRGRVPAIETRGFIEDMSFKGFYGWFFLDNLFQAKRLECCFIASTFCGTLWLLPQIVFVLSCFGVWMMSDSRLHFRTSFRKSWWSLYFISKFLISAASFDILFSFHCAFQWFRNQQNTCNHMNYPERL